MLSNEAAARKDKATSRATMEHHHFATVANIIKSMHHTGRSRADVKFVARYFADELAATNPNFDRVRFLRACGCA